jgi:hypothetical protein
MSAGNGRFRPTARLYRLGCAKRSFAMSDHTGTEDVLGDIEFRTLVYRTLIKKLGQRFSSSTLSSCTVPSIGVGPDGRTV